MLNLSQYSNKTIHLYMYTDNLEPSQYCLPFSVTLLSCISLIHNYPIYCCYNCLKLSFRSVKDKKKVLFSFILFVTLFFMQIQNTFLSLEELLLTFLVKHSSLWEVSTLSLNLLILLYAMSSLCQECQKCFVSLSFISNF